MKQPAPWKWLGVFLLCLLPFIRRPYFFDDSSVATTAEAVRSHPLHPYDYRMDFALPDQLNWAPGGLPGYTHPPLSAWVLGPLTQAQTEWPLHAAVFLFAMAALWGVVKVSGFFVEEPVLAAALVAFSPAFFLTSLTLYPHLFYFTFAIWAVFFTLRLADGGSWADVFGGAICLCLAALSLHAWPLLLLICAWLSFFPSRHRVKKSNVYLGTALFLASVMYGGWCLWETHLYGMPHFLATYRVRVQNSTAYPWMAAILPAIFMTGSAPFISLAWPALCRRRRDWCGVLIVLGVLLGILMGSRWGGFNVMQSALLAFLFATGLAFVCASLLGFSTASRTDRFLIVWFLIEFLFVQKYLVYPSAHHLLTLLIPASLLTIRMAETMGISRRSFCIALAAMGLFSVCLAQADLQEAKTGPDLALTAAKGPAGNFYWGNCFSGYTYYLKRAGWSAFDPRVPPHPGDRVLIPQNLNAQGPARILHQWPARVVALYPYRSLNPLRTLSLGDSAGWYSASWGALPFSLSSQPIETFVLIEYGT